MGAPLLTVVGARPNFVKHAALSRALRSTTREILVHTGQHWDAAMSDDLFRDLNLPAPDYHLGIGAGSPTAQIARILEHLEPVLVAEKPRAVIVYGDTNSALASALCAARVGVPVAHVEAGLRSFDRAQVEEQNRVAIDHLSALLFSPTEIAVANLEREGMRDGVHRVGDVMLDTLRAWAATAKLPAHLEPRRYYYVTTHRAETVDRKEALAGILDALAALDLPAVFPVHPRTRARMTEFGLSPAGSLLLREPAGYLESLALVRDARAVLTDSGGLVREAFFLGTPCVTLRDRTEWPETLARGRNRLGGTRRETILEALGVLPEPEPPPAETPLGDGHAAERIAELLR